MAQARPEPTEATNVGRCTVRMTKKTNGGRRPRGGGYSGQPYSRVTSAEGEGSF
jgi:hypothetical protein